jgi:hypothetical protein
MLRLQQMQRVGQLAPMQAPKMNVPVVMGRSKKGIDSASAVVTQQGSAEPAAKRCDQLASSVIGAVRPGADSK